MSDGQVAIAELRTAVLRELMARYALLDRYLGVVWGRNDLSGHGRTPPYPH